MNDVSTSVTAATGRDTGAPARAAASLHPAVTRMALAHLVVDGYANIYSPLLPLLIPKLGLSLTAAGTLAMLFQLAASFSQLGFGALADRWHPRRLVTVGPVICVVGLSLVGMAQTPLQLALVLMAGGLGTAAFHPPAAMLAHRLGGARPGLAMAVYITGGTVGFAFGPMLFAPFAERFGLDWTPLVALPGLAVIALFLARVPRFPAATPAARGGVGALRPYAKPLTLLYLIVVLRTLTSSAFAVFLPVMLTRRGHTVTEAAMAVSVLLLASGAGGFFGGTAADRFGARRVIAASLLLSAPLLVLAPLTEGWALWALLAAGGFFLQSTLPVNVTFAQTIAPVSAATVSSLMMGVAWGTGSIAVPFIGMLADRTSIEAMLILTALAPLLGAACAWPLPGRDAPPVLARRERESDVTPGHPPVATERGAAGNGGGTC